MCPALGATIYAGAVFGFLTYHLLREEWQDIKDYPANVGCFADNIYSRDNNVTLWWLGGMEQAWWCFLVLTVVGFYAMFAAWVPICRLPLCCVGCIVNVWHIIALFILTGVRFNEASDACVREQRNTFGDQAIP